MSSDQSSSPDISSYRARTAPPSSYCALDTTKSTFEVRPSSETDYSPHLFDLIYPIRDAISQSTFSIPPIFLESEAVDSSVLLGQGASFIACLQRIPEGPRTIKINTQHEEYLSTIVKPAPSRPRHVVYKIARVAFERNGEPLPQYRRALQSVLTEIHSLTYPPLMRHKNIIDFLGVAWGSNPYSPLDRLPAIVVEHAQHGTLAQVLYNDRNIGFNDKHLLCLDVARGLSALHQSGLVHGDVKAENVLMCSRPNGKYIAKIADFGFSIIAATESAKVWIGGTDPWTAPEGKAGPIDVQEAKHTDTYSLGLLIWLVCVNGRRPFDFIARDELEATGIEHFKMTGRLLSVAKNKDWLIQYLKASYGPYPGTKFELNRIGSKVDQQASSGIGREHCHCALRDELTVCQSYEVQQEKLFRSLDDIFDHSLVLSPRSRDLDLIVQLLESDLEDSETYSDLSQGATNEGIPPSTEETGSFVTNQTDKVMQILQTFGHQKKVVAVPGRTTVKITDLVASQNSNDDCGITVPTVDRARAFWKSRGYKYKWLSWQQTRDLAPSMQNLVLDSFVASSNSNKSEASFLLCAYLMNGYGCKPNSFEAFQKLRRAADLGHHTARAYLHRVWSASGAEQDFISTMYLEDYAKAGSKPALEDFRKIGPKDKVEYTERWLSDVTGGVGADWLDSKEMLDDLTQSQWIEDDFLMNRVKQARKPLSQLILNKRGDTILHFVAMCGRWRPFKSLILEYRMDVNIQNPLGETPLLCACRSGQGNIAILCLRDYKADASIAAQNGESPLHWLIQFEDQYIEPIVKDLIANGANIDAATKDRVAHSRLRSTIDVDFQMPGTAASWAAHDNRPHIIQILLKYGANPHLTPKGASLSALGLSAYYHHHECLEVIITHLESKVTQTASNGEIDKRFALIYGPVVREAEHAADRFSMILRGGADYRRRLHSTLDILRTKTKFINFHSHMHSNLLYTAVSKAHDEVVDYMFEHEWLTDTINEHVGDAQRTPVLEAVRWNREHLVQKLIDHGADIYASAVNPFSADVFSWSALHVYAHEGHDRDISLVHKLVEMGLPVDGPETINTFSDPDSTAPDSTIIRRSETPFALAIRQNAFHLATAFLSLGADPNSLSYASGLFVSDFPLTVLGHLIISNARYSSARLHYLLRLTSKPVDFIVEPTRCLTALHRGAMGCSGITKATGGKMQREEFDGETNANIMFELLLRWSAKEQLQAQCSVDGNTALHFAIEAQSEAVTRALLQAGASASIENANGESPLQLACRLDNATSTARQIVSDLRRYQN